MGTDLLEVPSQLLIGSTETMQRALERPGKRALSVSDAKDLIRHSRYTLSRITSFWQRSRRALGSGIEGSLFNAECDRVKGVIQRYLELNRLLEAEIQQQPASSAQRQRLAALGTMIREAGRIQECYQRWSAKFSRPRRPIDWDAVAEVEAAHARGEHRSAREFAADLQQRGSR
jgi:hypothetical protein